MVLDHAPVTGLTLLFMTISTKINHERYKPVNGHVPFPLALRGLNQPGVSTLACIFAYARHLAVEVAPFGVLGTSLQDILLATSVIVQMRVLERRWGPSYFLSFLLSSSAIGVAALHLLVTESTYGERMPLESLRLLSAGASLVTFAGLATRYLHEIPLRSDFCIRVPGTSMAFTEKATFVLPLLKLILAPDGELQSPSHRRRAVVVDIGLWTRILLALVGVLLGLMSAHPGWFSCWLELFSKCICRPIINFLRPLLTYLFGPPNLVEHAVPRQQQRSHRGGAPTGGVAIPGMPTSASPIREDGGRIAVDNLSGGGAITEDDHLLFFFQGNVDHPLRRRGVQGGPVSTDAALSRPRSRRGGAASPSRSVPQESISPAYEGSIAYIQEMGLPRSRAEILVALRETHGDVNNAIELLLSDM
ncbi:unnamed protein product [Phytomonas sp. EM1]|nr:unnamed protein product [Phytomonas sp. EM1]|eukprot:CCW62570.1 unnamed protein product [Phytomonas sp. isolate EM1]